MRAALGGWLGAAVLASLLGGCGIPDSSEVVPRGAAPSKGQPYDVDNAPALPKRQDTTDRALFIENYLKVAAGDYDGAADRVRTFLKPGTDKDAVEFEPPAEIHVVRLIEDPLITPSDPKVKIKVQQVGVLQENGILGPPNSATGTSEYELSVQEIDDGNGLFVTKPAQVILLSTEALDDFYYRRTIYFWDRDYATLVPDVRYLPKTLTMQQQPNEIIKWLTRGPAPWLKDAVVALPQGTDAVGNVPAVRSGGKLQIDLSGEALPEPDDPMALIRLRHQLMWSLRPNISSAGLELKVEGQVQKVDAAADAGYLASNAGFRFAGEPQRFIVYGGRIHRLASSRNDTRPVPVVGDNDNRNIRTAAMTTVDAVTYAALTGVEGGAQVLRVGAAATGELAVFKRTTLPAPAGHPAWVVSRPGAVPGNATVLIPAAGRLHSFAVGLPAARPVEWPKAPAGITAVAVSPDAHRIAVIAGGRLHMAVMTAGATGLQFGDPREIRTVLRDVTAVDWSSEASVVVAGVRTDNSRGRTAIMDVSLDGVSYTDRLSDLGTANVTHLAAYPADPTDPGDANSVAYVADAVAWEALAPPVRIDASDLALPVPSPPAGAALPTAPFFLN